MKIILLFPHILSKRFKIVVSDVVEKVEESQ